MHQSDTIDRDGHITKRGDIDVRASLCEAGASLLTRVQKWSVLKAWGLRIAMRSSMMNAVVAVARKLAVILHLCGLKIATSNGQPKRLSGEVMTRAIVRHLTHGTAIMPATAIEIPTRG